MCCFVSGNYCADIEDTFVSFYYYYYFLDETVAAIFLSLFLILSGPIIFI